MWRLYLFSACHTGASFKLPLEKSIKHVQLLNETIHLYWSKIDCQKIIVFQAYSKIKLNTS